MNKMKLYTIIGAGLFALTSTTLLACLLYTSDAADEL